MKAKCPHCESGCEKCNGGFVTASLAEGEWYLRFCTKCGLNIGGQVVNESNPLRKCDPCLICGGDVEAVHINGVEMWSLTNGVKPRRLQDCKPYERVFQEVKHLVKPPTDEDAAVGVLAVMPETTECPWCDGELVAADGIGRCQNVDIHVVRLEKAEQESSCG